ncbi:MAG: hypothetical protein ACR2MP_05310 [Streptosporangiaceae bacterium]
MAHGFTAVKEMFLDRYAAAFAAAGFVTLVDPDRIGIWGSSYSAGHVIMLAGEKLQIKCDVGHIPEIGPTGPSLSEATVAAVTTAIGEGRLNDTVPAVSPTADGIGVMFDDGAYDWSTRVAEERAPGWRNEVRISGLTEPFSLQDHLAGAMRNLLAYIKPREALHAAMIRL